MGIKSFKKILEKENTESRNDFDIETAKNYDECCRKNKLASS